MEFYMKLRMLIIPLLLEVSLLSPNLKAKTQTETQSQGTTGYFNKYTLGGGLGLTTLAGSYGLYKFAQTPYGSLLKNQAATFLSNSQEQIRSALEQYPRAKSYILAATGLGLATTAFMTYAYKSYTAGRANSSNSLNGGTATDNQKVSNQTQVSAQPHSTNSASGSCSSNATFSSCIPSTILKKTNYEVATQSKLTQQSKVQLTNDAGLSPISNFTIDFKKAHLPKNTMPTKVDFESDGALRFKVAHDDSSSLITIDLNENSQYNNQKIAPIKSVGKDCTEIILAQSGSKKITIMYINAGGITHGYAIFYKTQLPDQDSTKIENAFPIRAPAPTPLSAQFNNNGTHALIMCKKTIYLLDLFSESTKKEITLADDITSAAFSNNGQYIIVTTTNQLDSIKIYDLNGSIINDHCRYFTTCYQNLLATVRVYTNTYSTNQIINVICAFTLEGTAILSEKDHQSGNAGRGEVQGLLPKNKNKRIMHSIKSLKLTKNDRYLLTVANNEVTIWDPNHDARERICNFTTAENLLIADAAIDNENKRLAIVLQNGTVYIYDISSKLQ